MSFYTLAGTRVQQLWRAPVNPFSRQSAAQPRGREARRHGRSAGRGAASPSRFAPRPGDFPAGASPPIPQRARPDGTRRSRPRGSGLRASLPPRRPPPPLAQGGKRSRRNLLRETGDAEVGAVDLQKQGRAAGDGLFVVLEPRPVRPAHLDEDRPAFGHDVGDPERAADLHEFTAADQDLPPPGQPRPSGSGARPRLVWMTTPVALITRRSDGASPVAISVGSRDSRRAVHSSRLRKGPPIPEASRRKTEIVLRMASTTTVRGTRARSCRISGVSSREATDGRLRNRSGSGIEVPPDHPFANSRRRTFFPYWAFLITRDSAMSAFRFRNAAMISQCWRMDPSILPRMARINRNRWNCITMFWTMAWSFSFPHALRKMS